MHLTGGSLLTNCLDFHYIHLHLIEVRIDEVDIQVHCHTILFYFHTEDTRHFQVELRMEYSKPNLLSITRARVLDPTGLIGTPL